MIRLRFLQVIGVFDVDEDVQVVRESAWPRASTASLRRNRPVRPDIDRELNVVRSPGRRARLQRGSSPSSPASARSPPESSRYRGPRRSSCQPTFTHGRASCVSPCAACRPRETVAICASGSRISMSASASMSLARHDCPACPLRRYSVFTWSTCSLSGICFRLRMMSVASSTTPWNRRELVQHPIDLHRRDRGAFDRGEQHRRSALPIVVPKPLSKGCAENRPNRSGSVRAQTRARLGAENLSTTSCVSFRTRAGSPASRPAVLSTKPPTAGLNGCGLCGSSRNALPSLPR